jgi:hypothetical protein
MLYCALAYLIENIIQKKTLKNTPLNFSIMNWCQTIELTGITNLTTNAPFVMRSTNLFAYLKETPGHSAKSV